MERLAQWVTVAMLALVLASVGTVILSPIWPDAHPAWTVALAAIVLRVCTTSCGTAKTVAGSTTPGSGAATAAWA